MQRIIYLIRIPSLKRIAVVLSSLKYSELYRPALFYRIRSVCHNLSRLKHVEGNQNAFSGSPEINGFGWRFDAIDSHAVRRLLLRCSCRQHKGQVACRANLNFKSVNRCGLLEGGHCRGLDRREGKRGHVRGFAAQIAHERCSLVDFLTWRRQGSEIFAALQPAQTDDKPQERRQLSQASGDRLKRRSEEARRERLFALNLSM